MPVRSALLLASDGAIASHRAHAHLLGVGGFADPPEPEISIPRGTTFRRKGVVVHESTDLELAGVRSVDGMPCGSPARFAMDLGAVVSEARFRHAVRELRHRHGVSSEDLLRTYLAHERRGRNGDLAYVERLVCVEVDGIQHRDDPEIRADDVVRQQALEAAGWTVIRIRSWALATDLAAALRQLRRHLVDS